MIDKNAAAFQRLPPGFEARTMVGLGFDRDVLEDAGIKEADAFLAVSSGDNSNILSARVARETLPRPQGDRADLRPDAARTSTSA